MSLIIPEILIVFFFELFSKIVSILSIFGLKFSIEITFVSLEINFSIFLNFRLLHLRGCHFQGTLKNPFFSSKLAGKWPDTHKTPRNYPQHASDTLRDSREPIHHFVGRFFDFLKFLPGVKRLCGIGGHLRCLLCHVRVLNQATMRNSKNHILGTKNHTGK